ncbi:MAG: porin family protein [Bacteroidales bacterium]|nr:porin family protein [Bacteroidales bacterium]
MKTRITITSLFLILAIFVNAQETDRREELTFGLKGGLSLSNVYDAEGEEFDADSKLGFTGGAFIAIPIGIFLGVQPEVIVTQKGFKGSGSLLGNSYSFKRTTTFLDIPLLVSLKPSEFVTFLVGPQFSYLLNQRDEFDSDIIDLDQEEEFENDNIRKNILGIVGGIDINVDHLIISARVGFDVTNNKGDGTSETPRYKNLCTTLSIGYRF